MNNENEYESIAKAAADWWVSKLVGRDRHDNGSNELSSIMACILADVGVKEITDKQAFGFAEVLKGVIIQRLTINDKIYLSCDYGPCGDLSFAADAAGINHLNCPFKTWMLITRIGVEVSDGYGKPLKTIFTKAERSNE